MTKIDLRTQGFYAEFKQPKESPITLIWAVLTLAGIGGSFFAVLTISSRLSLFALPDPLYRLTTFFLELFDLGGTMLIYLIFCMFLYLAMKLVLTVLFCREKDSVKLKMLKSKAIPICECKEALKIWQTIIVYALPVLLMYSGLFYLSLSSRGNPIYMMVLFFLAFFMMFDLTLVLYVLFFKIKDGISYISVDQHIYNLTLFSRTYVRTKKSGKPMII